ncbi:hypothetical protein OROGR_012664 [Orobanche gracilis]
MAEVQENNSTSSGIKLFGATITPKQMSQQPNDDHREEPEKFDDPDDPTVEKKPDKIIRCPRCKSMETKFCYFNNYNVKQPRHFCKGCQRYWTAGGALRDVPVGAGRRKARIPYQGMSEDGCLFDASGRSGVKMVVEWPEAEHRVFEHHSFRGKRRRCASNSQTC